jgi:hypothetical protein
MGISPALPSKGGAQVRSFRPPSSHSRIHEQRTAWIFSTRVHRSLYSLLLVATPLIMLRTFLQQGIASLSDLRFTIGAISAPAMLTTVAVTGAILLAMNIRKVSGAGMIAALIVLFMDIVAQQIADYYSAHRFYDLQQNWHYIAYGLFSYMMYRDLKPRGVPLSRIMLITFCYAFLFSTFDEAFQKYINTRVFDIGDIAKDAYGSVAGMTLIALGGRSKAEFTGTFRIRFPRLREYFRNPLAALVLIFIFALLLLVSGSLLSDDQYFFTALAISAGGFLCFWLLLHLSQFKPGKYALLSLLIIAASIQTYSIIRHRNDGITYSRYGLTVYKGIPVPYFDIMIRNDGSFRLVDKKHSFNLRDRTFFLKERPDILIVSSGFLEKGGDGFATKAPSQFVFNSYTRRGTQVIILNTLDACATFNRLKQEHKNVLFILHSTC